MKETSWDNIVFENRNREYGAYFLRKNYYKYLAFGFVGSAFITALVVSYFYITALGKQLQDYQEMFQFISVPMDMSEISQIQEAINNSKSLKSSKNKSTKIRITDSVISDSVAITKKNVTLEEEKQRVDTMKTDSVFVKKEEKKTENKVDSVFAVGDLPQFPGGQTAFNAYITSSLSLSEDVKNNTVHGLVQICFTIDKFGNPINIYVKKSINTSLDKILCEIIQKMPRWIPSRNYNERLKITYTIPIVL